MRDFAYKPQVNDDPIDVPTDVEGHPVYQASVFDSVQFDELDDGSYIQNDMTSILLNQEKYRRLLGDMNVNNILAQMHPTQSTEMNYRDWETDRKSTRLNSSHRSLSRMPSSA